MDMGFIAEVSVLETGGAQFERNRRGQLARRRRPPERGVRGVTGIGTDSAAPRFRTRGIPAAIVSRCPWGRKGARGAPAASARIEQLSGMPPRLDVVLHSEIDAHKKTSHFSCPRNGRQFKNEAGLLLPSGRGGFARQRVVTVLPKCGPRACRG